MARDAVAAARAQHVGHRDGLGAAAGLEHHAQAVRNVFDRFHFGAEFDLDAKALQMLAQDCLGAPLRKAALEAVGAAGLGEVVARDLPQAGAQELDAPDAHARAKERLDQAGPVEISPARPAGERSRELRDAARACARRCAA